MALEGTRGKKTEEERSQKRIKKRWGQANRWKEEPRKRRMSPLLMTTSKGKLSDRVRECQGEKKIQMSIMFSMRYGVVQRNGVLELRKVVKIGRAVVGR